MEKETLQFLVHRIASGEIAFAKVTDIKGHVYSLEGVELEIERFSNDTILRITGIEGKGKFSMRMGLNEAINFMDSGSKITFEAIPYYLNKTEHEKVVLSKKRI